MNKKDLIKKFTEHHNKAVESMALGFALSNPEEPKLLDCFSGFFNKYHKDFIEIINNEQKADV